MMKRSKSTEARQQQAIEQKSALLKNMETADFLKIQPLTYRTDVLASFSDASVIYDDRPVFQPMSFEIRRRERIFLDGKNGCGKSSLLKLLSEYAPEHTGTVTIGSGLVISYVPQDTSHLGGTLSQFAEKHHLDESLFKAILRKWISNACSSKKISLIFPEDRRKKCSSQKVSVSRLIYMYGTNH